MNPLPPFQTPSQLAARFGGTVEQAKALLTRNLAQTAQMADKAERLPTTTNPFLL